MDDELKNARMSLGHILHDTEPLSVQDYTLIGKFIQSYCSADFEARRVINSLSYIRLGESTSFALKLNDKDTLEHLMACADSCTWNADLAEGVRKVAEIFVMHRQLRHIFAHWSGRRVPGYAALIFITKSLDKQRLPKDAVMFEQEDDANTQYSLISISNVLQEQAKLEENSKYLANIAAQLESKATDIACQFAQDIADGKLESKPYKPHEINRA